VDVAEIDAIELESGGESDTGTTVDPAGWLLGVAVAGMLETDRVTMLVSIDCAVKVVPERTSVIIEVSTEVEIVGTVANDVLISSEVRVSRAVSAVVMVANAVWVAILDTVLIELWTSVEVKVSCSVCSVTEESIVVWVSVIGIITSEVSRSVEVYVSSRVRVVMTESEKVSVTRRTDVLRRILVAGDVTVVLKTSVAVLVVKAIEVLPGTSIV
jgi:hypothetical protein